MQPDATNLSHSQELYEILVNQVSDSILVTDAELNFPGPKIVYANPAFCKMTGYESSELTGKSPRLLQGPLSNRKLMENLKSTLLAGKDFSGETVNYKKDGTPYNVEWHISSIRDENGKPIYFVSVQRDITEKVKKGEFATRRLRLEMGITAATQILLSTSADLKILKYAMEQFLVFVDSERLYLFKNSKTEARADLFLEVADPSLPSSSGKMIQTLEYSENYIRWKKIFSSGGFLQGTPGTDFPERERAFFETRNIRSVTLIPLFVSNEWFGFAGFENFKTTNAVKEEIFTIRTFVDLISVFLERKNILEELKLHRETLEDLVQQRTEELNLQKERAETANRAKSEFLANMSHELRTPLNSIIGFSRLMQLPREMEKENRYKDLIFHSGVHLLNVINDILDLSRIEAGKLILNLSGFDLKDLVSSSVEMISGEAITKKIGIDFTALPEDGEYEVEADAKRIRQVMLNLLGNAIKFTPPAGNVNTVLRRKDNGYEIEVRDSGIGIPEEELQKIFETFYQIKGENRGEFEGSGLGLPIVKKIVEAHGGNIQVESKPERGTCFRILLPRFASNASTIDRNEDDGLTNEDAKEEDYPIELRTSCIITAIQDRIYDTAIGRYFTYNFQNYIPIRISEDFSKIPQKNLDSYTILLYDSRLLLEETEIVKFLRVWLQKAKKHCSLVLLESAEIPLPFREELLPFFPDYTIQNPFSLDKLKSILIEIQKERDFGSRAEKENDYA
ncbi:ATP-binding protein [Leptospira ellisii]|uniref:histidine kinase n=1 Tax=Leptospira ellisii TaxID=2023197 RepID=A0A2N0B3K6_9LEPT|nr:ATP-binding protein [Leptospira ellisii]MDV6236953.1 ATP-binding protein [Leptospira ellisii]PJZ91088.1 PAS domain-containing sensor histidine kinase [Leptospira ellisii]